MTLRFHDPKARSRVPAEPYELSLGPDDGRRVGLLANSFLDCHRLMAEVGEALAALRPGLALTAYRKDTTSPAPEDLIQRLVAENDAAVVAIAH